PLAISFTNGIREIGLFAQSSFNDTEEFTFTVFNGETALRTFTVGPANNTISPGVALFIGARATDNTLITRLTISSTSSLGPRFNNNFVIGPVIFANGPLANQPTVQFSTPNYSVDEGSEHVLITVTRAGDTSG